MDQTYSGSSNVNLSTHMYLHFLNFILFLFSSFSLLTWETPVLFFHPYSHTDKPWEPQRPWLKCTIKFERGEKRVSSVQLSEKKQGMETKWRKEKENAGKMPERSLWRGRREGERTRRSEFKVTKKENAAKWMMGKGERGCKNRRAESEKGWRF